MNENILIVDDEKEIADLIEVCLKNDGYKVHKFYNGSDAIKCIRTQKIDLAILDIMLPDIDGFQIYQKIREKYFFPIIMLTAKVEDTDKIMGLTIGEQCADLPFVQGLPIILRGPGRKGQKKGETQGQKASAEDFFHIKSSLLQYKDIIA